MVERRFEKETVGQTSVVIINPDEKYVSFPNVGLMRQPFYSTGFRRIYQYIENLKKEGYGEVTR